MVSLFYAADCSLPIENVTNLFHWNTSGDEKCVSMLSTLYTPPYHQVKFQLKWFFPLHVYGWSCVFFILALYAFFSFLNIRSQISNQPIISLVNLFICLTGLTRASCLSIDAYNMKKLIPSVVKSLLWDAGFFSLVSSFCFLQLLILQLTQVKTKLKALENKTFVSSLILISLAVMLILDIITSIYEHLFLIQLINHLIFATWGILVFCSFMVVGSRVNDLLKRMPNSGLQIIDPRCKGLLQLALLAPYNNLAPFVAAALMPTFLGPSMQMKSSSSASSGTPIKTTVEAKTALPKTILTKDSNLGGGSKDQAFKKQLSWKLEEKSLPQSVIEEPEEAQSKDDNYFNAVTLDTILNHIAYANTKGAAGGAEQQGLGQSSPKKQILSILKLTYLVAVCGIILSCINAFLLVAPYGILWTRDEEVIWPWFIIQSVSRGLEVLIASMMANLTKLPVSSRHDPLGYKPREALFSII